ncbi:MAG: hypothetical protein LBL52_03915 [Rickettsiales bacterium]|jgi:hypothetical protein|nr:hypothetical protein [Rickettsiales bacterium]
MVINDELHWRSRMHKPSANAAPSTVGVVINFPLHERIASARIAAGACKE